MTPADLPLYFAAAVTAVPYVTDRILTVGRHHRRTVPNPRGSRIDLRQRHALPPRRGNG